jgi:NAD(P) transhydrogenase subunit alpha
VIVVGALLPSLSRLPTRPAQAAAISLVARLCRLIMASVNIFGGFLVTQRMLAIYQKKKK